MQRFRSRQITMTSLGAIGTDNSIQILVRGLDEKHIKCAISYQQAIESVTSLDRKVTEQ
jgi:hypothetical protein